MKGEVIDGCLLVMHPDDTVGTAIEELDAGRSFVWEEARVGVRDAIDFGHKVALDSMAAGDPVRKYGEVIGRATADIPPGAWVHTHNVESQRGRGDQREGGADG